MIWNLKSFWSFDLRLVDPRIEIQTLLWFWIGIQFEFLDEFLRNWPQWQLCYVLPNLHTGCAWWSLTGRLWLLTLMTEFQLQLVNDARVQTNPSNFPQQFPAIIDYYILFFCVQLYYNNFWVVWLDLCMNLSLFMIRHFKKVTIFMLTFKWILNWCICFIRQRAIYINWYKVRSYIHFI